MDELDAAAALDGILGSRTLPSSWYTDPRIFELERRHIFGRAWEYVGTASQVARSGDYFTCEVAGVPVVVLRDAQETLRAFLNICRHRHHPVVQGAGRKARLTCFYHSWTYGLDGRLLHAPRSEESPGFDCARLSLQPVQVATWGEMVFVSVFGSSTPLYDALGAARERAAQRGLPIERAAFRGRRSMMVAANWKLVWDNNCECYHCPTVHARWYRRARLDPAHYFDRRIGPYHYETELQLVESQPSQFAYYVWPACYFQSSDVNYASGAHSERSSILVLRFVPLDVRSTRVDVDVLHVDDIDAQEAERRLDQTFSVIEEDRAVCENMQRAHDCGVAEPGTLLEGIDTEDHTLLWQRLVHRAIVTPDVPLYAPLNE